MGGLLIIAAFMIGGLIIGLVLYGVAYFAFRRGLTPPPEDGEPSSDLSEYKRFLSQQPTVDEIREKIPLDFDATVEKYRNKKEI